MAINFKPIFDYMDERFKEMKQELKQELSEMFNVKFDKITTALDGISKEVKETREEMAAVNYRVDQHEGRINTLEKRQGIKFSH